MKAIVCGANYGRAYLQAVASGLNTQLVGLLTRGSEASRTLAESIGLPLYCSVEEVPREVDIACVAVGGAAGEELTLSLLSRGKHVLCEHPVRSAFVRRACQVARETHTVFHVNGHFSDIEPVAAFVERALATERSGAPIAIAAVTNRRLLFSALEILARALGAVVPWSFVQAVPDAIGGADSATSKVIVGSLRNVPISLLLEVKRGAHDDGTDTHVTHQLSAMFPRGNLLLASSWGPVVWVKAPSLPRPAGPGTGHLIRSLLTATEPLWERVDSTPPVSTCEFLLGLRCNANQVALSRLVRQIETRAVHPWQREEFLEGVSGAYEAVMTLLRLDDSPAA